MSEKRGQKLADRLKLGIEQRIARQRDEAEAESQRGEWVLEERRRLFRDLFDFSAAVGHLDVVAEDGFLSIGFEGRQVLFQEAKDGGAVTVTGDGIDQPTMLMLHAELDLWVVRSTTNIGKPSEQLLFDKGLEHLLAKSLNI